MAGEVEEDEAGLTIDEAEVLMDTEAVVAGLVAAAVVALTLLELFKH